MAMLIPDVFYGTTREVTGRFRRVNTRLLRGEKVEDVLKDTPTIESQSRSSSLIRLGAFWSSLSGEHFVMHQWGRTLASDQRFSWEDTNKIRREAVKYLASTPWGTLVLNCPEQYYWLIDYPLNPGKLHRDSMLSLLTSTHEHGNQFDALGLSFSVGADSGTTFHACMPLSHYALALCQKVSGSSIEIVRTGKEFSRMCREHKVIEMLTTDDNYWKQVCAIACKS